MIIVRRTAVLPSRGVRRHLPYCCVRHLSPQNTFLKLTFWSLEIIQLSPDPQVQMWTIIQITFENSEMGLMGWHYGMVIQVGHPRPPPAIFKERRKEKIGYMREKISNKWIILILIGASFTDTHSSKKKLLLPKNEQLGRVDRFPPIFS